MVLFFVFFMWLLFIYWSYILVLFDSVYIVFDCFRILLFFWSKNSCMNKFRIYFCLCLMCICIFYKPFFILYTPILYLLLDCTPFTLHFRFVYCYNLTILQKLNTGLFWFDVIFIFYLFNILCTIFFLFDMFGFFSQFSFTIQICDETRLYAL